MENMPVFREIDLTAEVKKALGKEYNAPSVEYVFSNGRKFYRRDEDFGPYQED